MAAIENPLEVLSRAASMVETTDAQREAALKRSMDQSTDSELPAKMFKYRHLPPSPRINDRPEDDAEQSNRRCAGTQTSFSSFPHDIYQNQRLPDYKILDLDRISKKSVATPGNVTPAMSLHTILPGSTNTVSYPTKVTSPRNKSPSPPLASNNHGNTDDCNQTPLNLTTSTTSSSPPLYQQQRPSVITIAPSSYTSPRCSGETSPRTENAVDSYRVTSGDADVSSIDEHFRRSLGQTYPAVYGAAPNSPSPASVSPTRTWTPPLVPASPPPPPAYQPRKAPTPPALMEKPKEISINGTVDDHFAKSLGDKWKEINQPIKLDVLAGSVDSRSVDDHFAKALGETWLRIKATKEGSKSNPSSPNSNHN